MNLPKNGRVIIIDDKPSQAMPLIQALAKNKISTTYFDAKKETFPVSQYYDVRVLFLDINLNDGPSVWETEKSLLINTIQQIIAPKTPYIIFLWSVNEVDNTSDVIKLFKEELNDYAPLIEAIPLKKYELFDINVDSGEYEIASGINIIKEIEERITQGLKSIDSIEALLKWEDIVSDSAALVVNDIVKLSQLNNEANIGLKHIYYNLAHAYWGQTLKGQTPNEITAKSLVSLNSILSDKIEFKLSNELKIEFLNGFPEKMKIESAVKSEINTRLLFSEDVVELPLPGNLYLRNNDAYKKKIVEDLIDRRTFSMDYCKENSIDRKDFFEGDEIKTEYKKPFEKYGFKKTGQAVNDGIYMELELTPICDYSQNNRIFCRMISGVILNEEYWYNRKRNAEYFYVSPTFVLDGKLVNFYCDLRYVMSIPPESLQGIKPRMRIRHLFQTDIQSQLARQVSRPGIVSL